MNRIERLEKRIEKLEKLLDVGLNTYPVEIWPWGIDGFRTNPIKPFSSETKYADVKCTCGDPTLKECNDCEVVNEKWPFDV